MEKRINSKKDKNNTPMPPPSEKVRSIIEEPPSKNDPQGWYTGKPTNSTEVPTQDADDL